MSMHLRSVSGVCRVVALLLTCIAGLSLAQLGHAQQQLESNLPSPRLMTVMPPGGKIGTSVEVTFTGTDIEEPEHLLFSHPGIRAEPIAMPEKAEAKAPTPPPKQNRRQRPMGKPSVSRFKVTLSPEVPPGIHDVRFVNKWGVSNPRAFVAGDLGEVLEKEPNNDVEQAQRVEMNSTINGSMASPTDVDYYVFAGKKGRRVILSCLASTIDSRFHAGLEVYDARGKQLVSGRDYHDNDALADCTLPEDGDYFVRVYQFTYTQGTAEHFYRLSISTAPWIDAVFPCVVPPGKATTVTVYGRNLPGGKIEPLAGADEPRLRKSRSASRHRTMRGSISRSADSYPRRWRDWRGSSIASATKPAGRIRSCSRWLARRLCSTTATMRRPRRRRRSTCPVRSPATSRSGATAIGTRSRRKRARSTTSRSSATAWRAGPHVLHAPQSQGRVEGIGR